MIISKEGFNKCLYNKHLYYGGLETYDGSIYIHNEDTFVGFRHLVEIRGNFDAVCCKNFRKMGKLEIIEGRVRFMDCPKLKSLGRLHTVGGDLSLKGCDNLTDISSLKNVGGNLNLKGCDNLTDISSLKNVDGVVHVYNYQQDLINLLLKKFKWKDKLHIHENTKT